MTTFTLEDIECFKKDNVSIKRQNVNGQTFVILVYHDWKTTFENIKTLNTRGVICIENEDKTLTVVCQPFKKFFENATNSIGKKYNNEIIEKIKDDNYIIHDKLDGSIVKVWNYNNIWYISSNSSINCDKDMKEQTLNGKTLDEFCENLNKSYVYMFEVIYSKNGIVKDEEVNKDGLYLIGCFDMKENKEIDIYSIEGFNLPKIRNIKFEELEDEMEKFDKNLEGYILRVFSNGEYFRIKYKYKSYYLRNTTPGGIYRKIVKFYTEDDLVKYRLFLQNFYPEEKEKFDLIMEYGSKLKDKDFEFIKNTKNKKFFRRQENKDYILQDENLLNYVKLINKKIYNTIIR